MQHIDLCSGIGGFSLGFERAGMRTVAFCEQDKFCQRVLNKHWPHVPVYDDVRRFEYDGAVDIISAGYPCQPFSVAGQRKGAEDDRHIWPEISSIVDRYQPRWCVFENVAGHISMGLDEVLFDLEGKGYTCQSFIIPACAVGAPHRRDRVWVIAHTASNRCHGGGGDRQKRCISPDKKRHTTESKPKWSQQQCGSAKVYGATANDGQKRSQRNFLESLQGQSAFSWCNDIRRFEDYFYRSNIPKPLICREDDGFSGRVDRLRALGNSIVPQIAEIIGQIIMDVEHQISTSNEAE